MVRGGKQSKEGQAERLCPLSTGHVALPGEHPCYPPVDQQVLEQTSSLQTCAVWSVYLVHTVF